ncbi:Fungal Zn2-Cys6 binuclear cluster domain-containing protein isoform 2 [Cladophialophora immunda]|nr:Fungal Zn2-Cys6 binuclear cluster domain-containing protein isoform 2 [Cladophialophora immunda]
MADSENATMADSPETARTRDKVHHTVTACVRCRQRKTRCDPALPRCEPCERSNAHCEYYDSTKNRTIPRTYITSLQETVRRLNEELKALQKEDEYEPDHEAMARGAGLVKFSENDECRFLGPSSGIAITRFVMEFAKQNSIRRTIKDVVPQHAAQEIKDKFDAESSKPTSKVYPLISSVAAPDLPNRDLMDRLVEIYMAKAQYMLPLLHEPSFRKELQAVYDGSRDPTLNFQVRLVVAISMQKLDKQYAGLADSYYLAALPFLTGAVQKMDLSTLQCFALIAQYSLLTPTRTAAYWVVGIAARLCQELGLCEEETIHRPPSGARPNALEVDMRRRLFWIITSMEYGLAHSLGRPSAFGVTVDNINVNFFELCDDKYISADGLLPGHHPIMKKCISIHFFKMRLLQAEIRRTLYLKKREQQFHPQPEMLPASTQPMANPQQQYIPVTTHPSLPRIDATSMHYSLPGFDPHSFPATTGAGADGGGPWTAAPLIPGVIPGITGSPNMNYDELPYLASFGHEYSRYMGQSFPPPGPAGSSGPLGTGAIPGAHPETATRAGGAGNYAMQSLSSQQQMELMAILEREQSNGQLPDVSGLISDATTFYTAQLP